MPSSSSQRVISLSAVCIRKLAAVHLDTEVTESQARDLSLSHSGDLESAIRMLKRKLELHKGPEGRALAIAESSLVSALQDVNATQTTTKVRIEALQSARAVSQIVATARKMRERDKELRDDILRWEADQRRFLHFLDALDLLYVKIKTRLRLLHLSDSKQEEAESALETILQRAVLRAREAERTALADKYPAESLPAS
jgi:hypothetical protein